MAYVMRGVAATGAALETVDDYVDTEVAAILADTNELQTDLVNGGRLDLLIDGIKAKTDNLPSDPADESLIQAAIASLANGVGGNVVSKQITYAAATSYNVFTVTGLVAVKVAGYITTPLTNHADTTSLGTASSAAGLLAATAGTAMQTANQVWVDNAPSKFEAFPTSWTLIGDGEDIVVASTANIAGGVVTFFCWYMPISSGAAVAAAA
jgi:hypothetical protein